ncbi:MAG: glycosyltransferase family 2 protein [Prolixibacteraceae bacterium]|nr:glycosyltransferase family 2 protein [Prolixibacteraceae bacterium]
MLNVWEIIFWVSGSIIFYTFGGYGILLFIFLKIKNLVGWSKPVLLDLSDENLPDVCLIIAAYNEKDYVDQKIQNSLSLIYPPEKLKIIWVNDGSDDGTPDLVAKYPQIVLLHNPKRSGKIEGMNRGVENSVASILLFSDANTMLSPNSLIDVIRHFQDATVGCVAGEKQFYKDENQPIAAVGEGFYWKIESWLKQLDYQFYSTIGATGELFAIRRELFHRVEPDTVLDDFMISMRTTEQGYRVAYEPAAVAIEHGSSNVKEELKRKVRIAAGCYQSMFRLKKLLNPFFHFSLFFQYVSHKVMRWTLAPIALITLLISSILIVIGQENIQLNSAYSILLFLQILFYFLAAFGYLTQNHPLRIRFIYTPFYFIAMNYAMFKGFFRFLKGKQTVLWEKAQRA